MGLSCIFEGYGKFCSGKNITKRSLFEVENPCLSSFLGKFLHSLKRANPTTTAAIYSQSWRTDFEFLPVSPDGVIYCAYRVKIRATLQCLLCYSLFFACRFPTISLPQRHCGRFLPPLPLRHLEVTWEMGVGRR